MQHYRLPLSTGVGTEINLNCHVWTGESIRAWIPVMHCAARTSGTTNARPMAGPGLGVSSHWSQAVSSSFLFPASDLPWGNGGQGDSARCRSDRKALQVTRSCWSWERSLVWGMGIGSGMGSSGLKSLLLHYLCGFGQITAPFWALVSSLVKQDNALASKGWHED